MTNRYVCFHNMLALSLLIEKCIHNIRVCIFQNWPLAQMDGEIFLEGPGEKDDQFGGADQSLSSDYINSYLVAARGGLASNVIQMLSELAKLNVFKTAVNPGSSHCRSPKIYRFLQTESCIESLLTRRYCWSTLWEQVSALCIYCVEGGNSPINVSTRCCKL